MVARKKQDVKPEFPPLTCGTCSFFVPEDKDVSLCWVDQPKIVEHEDGVPVFSRGTPVEPLWPRCKHFEPRYHA